jgi:hypothetical protein
MEVEGRPQGISRSFASPQEGFSASIPRGNFDVGDVGAKGKDIFAHSRKVDKDFPPNTSLPGTHRGGQIFLPKPRQIPHPSR